MEKKKPTAAELEAQRRARAERDAWVRGVLERAEASLPEEQRRPDGASNSEWLQTLAERGKARLEARGADS